MGWEHGVRYLGPLYASKKIATQGWVSAGGNRRKEALPYWCHRRGVKYEDGLYLPTKSEPLVDGMTGATPRADFDVRLKEQTGLRHFYVMVEVNHSIDFNDRYSKDKKEDESDYSGGSEGSGQPALVYKASLSDLCYSSQIKAEYPRNLAGFVVICTFAASNDKKRCLI